MHNPKDGANDYVTRELMPTLMPALVALARERPADPVTWLAQRMIETKLPKQPKEVAVEVVLVIGLEVSGGKALCADLASSVAEATGRPCVHLEVPELLKVAVASGSPLGTEISLMVQQGKMVKKATLAALVKEALEDAPPGTYLLQGYPTSPSTLANMGEEVGYVPRLALLLELSEDQAMARLADSPGPPPLQRIKSFHMHSRGMIAELEKSQLLRRIDAAQGHEAILASALSAVLH